MVPSYTFLKPGSNRVEVMLKNITAQPVTIKAGDKVARVEPANVVLQMLAPKPQEGRVPIVNKSAEVDLRLEHEAVALNSSLEVAGRNRM